MTCYPYLYWPPSVLMARFPYLYPRPWLGTHTHDQLVPVPACTHAPIFTLHRGAANFQGFYCTFTYPMDSDSARTRVLWTRTRLGLGGYRTRNWPGLGSLESELARTRIRWTRLQPWRKNTVMGCVRLPQSLYGTKSSCKGYTSGTCNRCTELLKFTSRNPICDAPKLYICH
ncbi:hypothetical protein HOLleu_31365 [Holothuria leucospilota]|uniref:Uncharacterized protein n=1 Tax=Holothuria leucospilota TaxID=206669 RepID=A0A9Q0YRR9_HOLLE|nr:hypothetical protein HOLleu_31365 [Holothuria leucospilota]